MVVVAGGAQPDRRPHPGEAARLARRAIPALLALVPAFLASAGALGGILSSRLTSELHLGIIDPTTLPAGRRPPGHPAHVFLLAVPDLRPGLVVADLLGWSSTSSSPGPVDDGRRRARAAGCVAMAFVGRRRLLRRHRRRSGSGSTPTTYGIPSSARRSTSSAPSSLILTIAAARHRQLPLPGAAPSMDDRPRNLRAMLSEAKDTSELMVDLAYAALYFGDPDMAEEVGELEEQHERARPRHARRVRARRPQPAGGRGDGVGAAGHQRHRAHRQRRRRHRPHRHPPPRHPPRAGGRPVATPRRSRTGSLVREGSHMARRPLSALELPVQTGMRVMAIRREPGLDHRRRRRRGAACPATCCSCGARRRASPGCGSWPAAPRWEPPVPPEDGTLTDLDRAVDVLVEMKNISEVAVGLAYSALVLRDQGLAAEVRHLEDRLDEMKDRLELWVLRAGGRTSTRRRCGGCCTCPRRPRTSATRPSRWCGSSSSSEELHPILALALGEIRRGRRAGAGRRRARGPTARRSASCGSTSSRASTSSPSAAAAATSTGRAATSRLQAGDELIATGPDEGRAAARRAPRLAPRRGRGDRRAGARAPRPRRLTPVL